MVFQPGVVNRTPGKATQADNVQASLSVGEQRRAEADISRRPDESSTSPMNNAMRAQLQSWAEPGQSTPQKHAIATSRPAESWDDDFEDKTDSPVHRRPHTSDGSMRRMVIPKFPMATQKL